MVGLFINSVPQRIAFAPEQVLVAWLQSLQAAALAQQSFESCTAGPLPPSSEVPATQRPDHSRLAFDLWFAAMPRWGAAAPMPTGGRHSCPIADTPAYAARRCAAGSQPATDVRENVSSPQSNTEEGAITTPPIASSSITTDAWVLHAGEHAQPEPGQLRRERFTFAESGAGEVLVEPIYGCWEGNMTHALNRRPIDIARHREESAIIIGNSGVVRVLRPGPDVTTVRPGDLCLLDGNFTKDRHGYTLKVLGYDAPSTMGLLAKQTKIPAQCLIPLPQNSSFTAKEWTAFSVRYLTAWDNWEVAWRCFQAQLPEVAPQDVFVWGWGGGVSLAQLTLARHAGCQTAMICSSPSRSALLQRMGVLPIDRNQFGDLSFDEKKYQTDAAYRARYLESERTFLRIVQEHTRGEGVSIFIDNIGAPVFRATLKALARQGVVATSGWKHGMQLSVLRGLECINRHIHVHTHGSRDTQARRAVQEAEGMGWRPPVAEDPVYAWEQIPQLALDYEAGRIDSYFPIFEVNPL